MAKRRKKSITSIKKKEKLKNLSQTIELDDLSQFVIAHIDITQPIIEQMKQGLSDEEIVDELKKTKTTDSALKYLSAARQVLKAEHSKKRKLVVATHLRRYDRDITRLRYFEPQTDSYSIYIERKTNALWKMMDTMHQKEKLLGMHSKSFKIAINNTTNVNVKEVKSNFNLNALTIEEKIDFLNLIDKCKTGNIIITDEKGDKKLIENNKEDNIEDAEYEIVEDNINFIKVVENKKEEPIKEKSVLTSIEDKIKKALLEKAQKQHDKTRRKV